MMNLRLKSAFRLYRTTLAALVAWFPAACVSTALTGPPRIAPLNNQPEVQVAEVDFHALSPAMEKFLDLYVPVEDSRDRRAWNLVWATTDENVLGFDYEPSLTKTSIQTFAERTGNCLAFSSMLVAMARQRGLTAWYQEVEVPPNWQSVNNTLLVSKHINVVVEGNRDEWEVDISGRREELARKNKRISDKAALAQYYNNLGADALMQEELAEAYAYIVKAIETDASLSFLWSNLAVVYSRNHQNEEAKRGYLTALRLDPRDANAANNLYLIYEQEGNYDSAQKYKRIVERHRKKNPYYLYYLSSLAFDEGRYQDSRDMLRKAIDLQEKEYRFHYSLARSLAQVGELNEAQAALDRALQLAPEEAWLDASMRGVNSLDDLPALPD